jgi:NAD-dependent deacetylase
MRRLDIAVLTGAGMSAESGLKTFRDNGGLWENHRVEEVATPGAWRRDPALVLRFYNERRRALLAAEPNAGHRTLAAWEARHRVRIVTQNVDDLHERAGSTGVLHLHGELMKARSTADDLLVVPLSGPELNPGDLCPLGAQLRPHIVWFGEAVDAMPEAAEIVAGADVLVVVGTSLQVYPAAGLVAFARRDALRILVDPAPPPVEGFAVIRAGASEGLAAATRLLEEAAG